MAHSTRIRKGDEVVILAGEDRGQRGRVLRVISDRGQVVVENVNLVYKHIRRSQQKPQGGRVRRENPLHISNVMLVDPETGDPTRIGRMQKEPERGSLGWVRVSRRTGKEIDHEAGGSAKGKKKKKKSRKKAGD